MEQMVGQREDFSRSMTSCSSADFNEFTYRQSQADIVCLIQKERYMLKKGRNNSYRASHQYLLQSQSN